MRGLTGPDARRCHLANARGGANDAIRTLLELAPHMAVVIRDREPVEMPTAEVKVGDLLLIRPGAKIPVDGTVIEGESEIDESMVTGESLPVAKAIDSQVIGASLNTTGTCHQGAVGHRAGPDCVLVQQAQTPRRPANGSPTGTLTRGEPEVTDVLADGLAEDELLTLAAALERESEHPLAQAVARHADEARVPRVAATAFRNVPGHGAQGQVDGRRVLVGMWPDAEPKAERPRRSCASSSATSPAKSSVSSPTRTQSQHPQPDRHPEHPRGGTPPIAGAGPGLPTPAPPWPPRLRGQGRARPSRSDCAATLDAGESGRTRCAASRRPTPQRVDTS
jgi:E1-E2 ATPase